jgi:hypothetical protein
MKRELLQRNTINENFDYSPFWFGALVGYVPWMAYAWVTQLQCGVLLSVAILSLVLTSMALDVPENPAIRAMCLFLLVVSMLTLFLTVFCDPGICAAEAKDGLTPVRTIPQPFAREIVQCMSNFLYRLLKTLFGENAWIHFV